MSSLPSSCLLVPHADDFRAVSTSFLAAIKIGGTGLDEPRLSACTLLARSLLFRQEKKEERTTDSSRIVGQAWNMLAYMTARLFSLTHADTIFAHADSNPLQIFSRMFRQALNAHTLFAHIHPGKKTGIFAFAVDARTRTIAEGELVEKKMSPGPLKKLLTEYLSAEGALRDMETPWLTMTVQEFLEGRAATRCGYSAHSVVCRIIG